MTTDFRIEEMIYMMKKISLDITTQLESNLKETGMSGGQVYFMVYMLRHNSIGTYITELSREIGISKPTLSALIKKLKEKKYIYFKEHPKDARKKKVIPTEKMIAEGKKLIKQAEQLEAEIFSSLDSQEKDQLWNLEQKVLAQLSRMEENKMKEDRRNLYREKNITTA